MEKFFFMRPVLAYLAESRNMNHLLSIALRVIGVLAVPFSLVLFFMAGKVIFELPPSGILGGILFQLLLVIAIYAVVHVLFMRARDIERLPAGPFNMLPLSALLVRALGETYCAFVSLVSIGGGTYVWFTGKSVNTLLGTRPSLFPMFGEPNFLGGIQFMVAGLMISLAVLVVCYLVAELLMLVRAAVASRLDQPQSQEEPRWFRAGS